MIASPASFTSTGQDALFRLAMLASGATFALTGIDATLTYAGGAVDRVVATRGEVPNLLTSAISTSTQLRKIFRTRHYMGGQDATELRLAFCNYYCLNTTGEASPGNTCDVEASIEWPGATPGFVRIKFSGVNSYTMADGEALIVSDALLPSDFGLSSFPANTQFWVRHARTIPNNGRFVRANGSSSPSITGEGGAQCDPATDPQLDTTGALSTSGSYTSYSERLLPLAIVGKTVAPELAVGGAGDSITYRTSDTAGDGQNGAGGWFQRGLASVSGRHVPYVNMASPGERSQNYAASSAKRQALYPYLTHMTFNHNTNDLGGSRTPTQIQGDNRTCWSAASAAGLHVEHILMIPRTTSASTNWTSAADQTPVTGFATGGNRDTVNSNVIADVGTNGLAAYLSFENDVADITTPALDKFVSTGANDYATNDGTHPSPTIHGLMAATFATRVATWTP